MVFADPPYNLSNDGTTVHAGRRVSVNKEGWDRSQGAEADFEFHSAWIDACRRLLKSDGTLWVSGTYHSIFACGHALQLLGFRVLNDIAWYKRNPPPNLGRRMFTAAHETLIWASRSAKSRHTFNYDAMRDGDFPGDILKNPGKQMHSVWAITPPPPGRSATANIRPRNPKRYLTESSAPARTRATWSSTRSPAPVQLAWLRCGTSDASSASSRTASIAGASPFHASTMRPPPSSQTADNGAGRGDSSAQGADWMRPG